MALFLGVTMITLVLAYFCNTSGVQLHRDGCITRQGALNRVLLMAIYVILTALSACRIASGNDYWEYTEMFSLIAQFRTVSTEIGFNWFVRFMQALFGRSEYLPIFGAISVVTMFFFLKAIYQQGEWFLGSIFLFLMNGYYFSSFNSIRYYLVLAIALYTMKFVVDGEYGKFILWILFAALFHKSVLLVIPVYLFAKWIAVIKLKKWHFVAGAVLIISLIFARNIYREIIFFFYPFYEGSAFDHVDYSVTNIAKCLGTLALCVICYKGALKENVKNRFYAVLNIGGLVLYTAGAFIPEVSRVAYYLVISQIFLIPSLLVSLKEGWFRKVCICGVAVVFIGYFALFLRSAYSTDIRLLPYLNWIFN